MIKAIIKTCAIKNSTIYTRKEWCRIVTVGKSIFTDCYHVRELDRIIKKHFFYVLKEGEEKKVQDYLDVLLKELDKK